MSALPSLRTASSSVARTPVSARFNSTQAGSGPDASYGSATRSTVPPRSTHASYHPGGYGISEGLKRARKPYRFRNILTGSLIMGFATSVYFYSISKVGILCSFSRMLHCKDYLLTPLLMSLISYSFTLPHLRSSKTTFPILQRSGRLLPVPTLVPLQQRPTTSTKYDFNISMP